MSETFNDAIKCEVAWKHPEMQTFAVALVTGALALLRAGTDRFTTDVVADEKRGDGHGIAGSVVELLKTANVIEPLGVTVAGKWYPEREKSTREGCKSRYLGVYKLCSRGVAESFLRHNAPKRLWESQGELIAA